MKSATHSTRLRKRKLSHSRPKKRAFKVAYPPSTQPQHGPVPPLELYQREDCPFSHAVRNRLSSLGLDFVAHNVPIHNALKHEMLVQAGGKDQVPFLVDHTSGVKLYESQAILNYLDQAYGPPAPTLLAQMARRVDTRIRGQADRIAWRVTQPLQRVIDLRNQVKEALQTIEGSFNFLRESVRGAWKTQANKPEVVQ